MPFGWDLIPGFNMGAGIRQLMTGKDEDVFSGITNSNRPGQMQIDVLPDIGVRPTGSTRVSGDGQTGNVDQNGSGGGVSGASTIAGSQAAADARERANTIGLLDSEIDAINKSLGNLDPTWEAGKRQIQDAYDKNLARANEQQSNALSKYATTRSDTKQGFNRALEDNDNQAYNMYSALQSLLGRGGAGSSSTATEVVPYTVSKTASKSRGALADNFGKNIRDLNTAEDETKQSYSNLVRDYGDQKNTSLGSLENDIQSKRSAAQSQLASLQGKKTQAAGGGWQQVKDSMQGAISARDDIDRGLATLLDRYRNPYEVKDVTVKDPTLANYSADTQGVKIDDPSGTGTDTDTSTSYLDRIREEEKRKKEQQGIVV